MTPKKNEMKSKMWGGRFSRATDAQMDKLSHSIDYDKNLLEEDIKGSLVHAECLMEAGVLSSAELKKIQKGLQGLLKDGREGKLTYISSDEDIHMALERILTDRIGTLGKKLHTGRSRNDQVATDFKLYIRNQSREIIGDIRALQKALLERAKEHKHSIWPGYTHLQQAQPIYLSHYLLAFFWALERDVSRFNHVMQTSGALPLGSGALAGSGFKYNRQKAAEKLGFETISFNSIDATSHRDFALEFLNACAICGNLLSRYAEDFVIWSSSEFGFLRLDDAFTTGSSMMPQKRNPDSMELIRGKSGRLLGNYVSLYTAAKGAPLSYSRDLQEDKEPVFDSCETILVCLKVMAKSLLTADFKLETVAKAMNKNLLATDLADALVKKGVPFRESHEISGNLVGAAEKKGLSFLELPDSDWDELPGGPELKKSLNFKSSIESRNILGGTGSKSIHWQIKKAEKLLKKAG